MRVRVFKDGEYVKTFEVDVSAAELTPMEDKVFTAAEAQIEHGSIVYFGDLYWKWDGGWWVNLAADNPAVAGLYAKAVAAETEPLRGVPMTPTSALQDNLARIVEAMKQAGYVSAVVTYDGGGDSGQFYEPVYTKADGTTVGERYIGHYMSPAEEEKKMEESGAITVLQTATRWVWKEGRGGYESVGDRKMLLITALMEFAGEFVHKDYRGWENNDGGQGNLTVDVETCTASLEHTTYYTESTTDTTTMHAPARAPVRMPDVHNTEER